MALLLHHTKTELFQFLSTSLVHQWCNYIRILLVMCRIITAAISGDELLLKLRPKYEQEPKNLKSFQKQCQSLI